MRREKGKTKILAIQGSPRPKTSNTELLLKEFLKGAKAEGADTETIYLIERDINQCVGCYTCFAKTPGVCVFKDDMPALLNTVRGSDILVYATPLYNYNMTALTKAFQERLLPLKDPHLIKVGGTHRLSKRFRLNQKMVLISTCGYPDLSNFDALRQVFKIIESNNETPLIGEILVPAAEAILKQECLRDWIQGILDAVYQAGVEVVRNGRISNKTKEIIQQPIISADDIGELGNLWWDSLIEGVTQAKAAEAGKKVEDIRLCLRGMAATLNGRAAGDLKATIQFEVTGKQPGRWSLTIENGKCIYDEGKANSPSLTINTSSEVWLDIANKELDGQQAFTEGKYTATGDLSLLTRMRRLFGGERLQSQL